MNPRIRVFSTPSALVLLILSAGAILTSGCDKGTPTSLDDIFRNGAGSIKTGTPVEVLHSTIPGSGAVLTVDRPGTPVDGLRLTVPSNTWSASIDFTISYAEITSHGLGAHFHPISPLIRIENGGSYGGKLMTLRIPVAPSAGAAVLALYYDDATGRLDAIPTISVGADYIEVAVRHFSEIVVTEVQRDLLREGGGFHTFFDPAVNGWSFVNNGTFPESGGCCGGMSIGAAYFYRDFTASLRVRSYFDNDQLWFQTPDTWEDDANGLKFVTELQREFISLHWNDNGELTSLFAKSEEDHFWAICYSLLTLNQPQLLHLDVSNNPSAPAHAILVYAYTIGAQTGTLSVYDPNFPGLEGTITFDFATKKFRPYRSAENARALAEGSTYYFDLIRFLPLTTICDLSRVRSIWQKVGAGTIGSGVFPEYELWAVNPDDPNASRIRMQDAKRGYTVSLPFEDFEAVIEPVDKSVDYKLVSYYDLPNIGMEVKDPAERIHLEYPSNVIGIAVWAKAQGRTVYDWAGFHWFRINKKALWIEPPDTTVGVNQEIRFVARHNGTAPKPARWEWDFGDKTGKQIVTGDSTIDHTYLEQGTYRVSVALYDDKTNALIGEATAQANIAEWTKISIILLGASGSDTSSTIRTDDGVGLPSISFSTTMSGVTGQIVWNDDHFEVDYTFRIFPADYTGRISGTLSADKKRLISASAILTGTAYDGDWQFSSSMTLSDFPLDMVGDIFGGELSGPQAHAKVGNLAWEQRTPTITQRLGSVDWSSSKTKLSVYFRR